MSFLLLAVLFQHKASWLFYYDFLLCDDHDRELVHKELEGFENKKSGVDKGNMIQQHDKNL